MTFYWRRLDDPLQASDNAQKHTRVGTCAWMAPEILMNKPYDEKVDIWSYGVTCWEALTGKLSTRTTLRQPMPSHHARRHPHAHAVRLRPRAHATPHARRSSKLAPMRRCSQPHIESHRRPCTHAHTPQSVRTLQASRPTTATRTTRCAHRRDVPRADVSVERRLVVEQPGPRLPPGCTPWGVAKAGHAAGHLRGAARVLAAAHPRAVPSGARLLSSRCNIRRHAT